MKSKPKKIEAYDHSQKKRTNIPTAQSEEQLPSTDKQPVTYRYSPPLRDRSGPKLSWDRAAPPPQEISVLAHPLFIHEKVSPHHFVEALANKDPNYEQQGTLDVFNGLPEEAKYEWYRHKGNWQNRIIRGDSARIMASLAAKENLRGKVQMIFSDPPYGISFKSNFQTSTRSRNLGAKTAAIPNDVPTITAFRDTYENGIHSYIDSIYRNSSLAHSLLANSGSYFLQIGKENGHRLALILDEIFGPENRVATIVFAKTGGSSTTQLSEVFDYLLWYAKDIEELKKQRKYHQLYERLETQGEIIAFLGRKCAIELADGTVRRLSQEEKKNPNLLPEGARLCSTSDVSSIGVSNTGRSEPYEWNGQLCNCPPGRHWSVSKEGLDSLAQQNRLATDRDGGFLHCKVYQNEIPGRRINNLWHRAMQAQDQHYVVETSEAVIERCILMSSDPGDLVMDINCGSGTTAFVAEKQGRRWITTDTSAVAIALTRQRIATGIYNYYLLQDSPEGAKMEAKLSDTNLPDTSRSYGNDISKGFVYERVPYVSAATLAYKKKEESTLLYNRPKVKPNTIRVSSPFTVESESPFKYIPAAETEALNEYGFIAEQINSIKSTLEITGINLRDKTEQRLMVRDCACWLDHQKDMIGKITHTALSFIRGEESMTKVAAVSIAPDDITVSNEYVRLAHEAATKIANVEQIIVIAFAFEPTVRSGALIQQGPLEVVLAQANRDLLIDVGKLKDSARDRAFVMIGEPDVRIHHLDDDKIAVEILGYDTFNPSTGNIEDGDRKSIDCWMIDSEYNELSFFARHIHFPEKSKDKQIDKLRRELAARKQLDSEAWNAMLSYRSIPFPRPENGRIAVRIITDTFVEMTCAISVPESS